MYNVCTIIIIYVCNLLCEKIDSSTLQLLINFEVPITQKIVFF